MISAAAGVPGALTVPRSPEVAGLVGYAPEAGAPAASATGASSAGAMNGMVAISGAMLGMQFVQSIYGYLMAKDQIASQLRMAEHTYAHQDKLAKLDRDSKMGYLDTQQTQQKIMADGATAYNKAVEERKKAEDGKIVMTAKIKQLKLNDRAGRLRNQPFYGRVS